MCLLCSLKESFSSDFPSLVKDCLPQSPPQCWDYQAPGDSTLASESACNCHLDNKLFSYFLLSFRFLSKIKEIFYLEEREYVIIYFALKIIFWIKSNFFSKSCARHCSQIRTLLRTSLELISLLNIRYKTKRILRICRSNVKPDY